MAIVGIIAIATLAILVAVLLRGLIVMLLWNWLMPVIFSLPELGFWQAVGLALLSTFLIGWGNRGGSNSSVFNKNETKA